MALGATATASSGTASAAVDGNDGSRWESAHADGEWLQLDLGSEVSLCAVNIHWEGAHADEYWLQAGVVEGG